VCRTLLRCVRSIMRIEAQLVYVLRHVDTQPGRVGIPCPCGRTRVANVNDGVFRVTRRVVRGCPSYARAVHGASDIPHCVTRQVRIEIHVGRLASVGNLIPSAMRS